MSAALPSTRPRPRRTLLWSVLPLGLLLVIAGLLGARAWVTSYLRSDDFRHFLERKTSAALRADARLEPLRWQDAEVFTEALDATGNTGSPFAKLTVEQVRARLDLHALWRRTWRVDSIDAERFAATLGNPHPVAPDTAAASAVKPSAQPDEGQGRGFLAALLPSRVEIGAVNVNDFSLTWNTGRVAGTRLTARPRDGGTQNWDIDGSGGRLEGSAFPRRAPDRFQREIQRATKSSSPAPRANPTAAVGSNSPAVRRSTATARWTSPRTSTACRSSRSCPRTGARACTATPPATSTSPARPTA